MDGYSGDRLSQYYDALRSLPGGEAAVRKHQRVVEKEREIGRRCKQSNAAPSQRMLCVIRELKQASINGEFKTGFSVMGSAS